MSTSEEDTYSMMFTSLKHPIRRKILRILARNPEFFSDLQRQIKIDSSHLTYHLEELGSLLLKTEDGRYCLSSLGEAAASTMKHVEEPSKDVKNFWPRSRPRRNILGLITIVLLSGLLISVVFNGFLLLKYGETENTYGTLNKAYDGLNRAYTLLSDNYDALDQTYLGLNKTRNQLEDRLTEAYNCLNSTYLTLLANSESNIVLNTNTGVQYETIQDAINAAQEGSTLLANKGVYYEHLIVNKSLTLVGLGRNDTVIDGSHTGVVVTIAANDVIFEGFTVQHSGADQTGIDILHSDNSIIRENVVTLNGMFAVSLDHAFSNSISRNIISSTIGSRVGIIYGDGIVIWRSSASNFISDNIITNCTQFGINLQDCQNNLISGNTLLGETISTASSTNNTFVHNNFLAYPGPDIIDSLWSGNSWSVGEEGNYWDDYIGLDDGSDGRIAGDGVGDTSLPWHGADDYPFISPVNPLQIVWDNQAFPTTLVSNSTISSILFDQTDKKITFSVNGSKDAEGYFNLSLPNALLSGPWTILLDETDATFRTIITENATQTTLHLIYSQSGHSVQIVGTNVVPEHTSPGLLIVLFLTLTSAFLIHARKSRPKKITA
jgi:parallel beta-helix repeat protein